ncbi:hypothetical protein BH10BAC3_BH10BAC3_11910 [soil metagenome]
MTTQPQQFELDYKNGIMHVQEIPLAGQEVFKIEMAGRKTLIIAGATAYAANRFWTSIPGGRQDEAERVGMVIEEYIQSKN